MMKRRLLKSLGLLLVLNLAMNDLAAREAPTTDQLVEQVLDDPAFQCLLFNPDELIADKTTFMADVFPKLFELAFLEKDARACNVMAVLHLNGVIGVPDVKQAEMYVGIIPESKANFDINLNQAIVNSASDPNERRNLPNTIKSLALRGHLPSQLLRGMSLVSKAETREEGMMLIEKASAANYRLARLTLFKIYHQGAFQCPKAPDKAKLLCETEVKHGNRDFYSHWLLLLDAEGRQNEAIQFSQKLADDDEVIGLKWLSTAYLSGRGVTKDVPKGMDCCRRAADLGDPISQHLYGMACLQGKGIDKSVSTAKAYLTKAAESVHADATFQLGLIAWNGEGEARDPDLGLSLINRAAELGSRQAKDFLAANSTSRCEIDHIAAAVRYGKSL